MKSVKFFILAVGLITTACGVLPSAKGKNGYNIVLTLSGDLNSAGSVFQSSATDINLSGAADNKQSGAADNKQSGAADNKQSGAADNSQSDKKEPKLNLFKKNVKDDTAKEKERSKVTLALQNADKIVVINSTPVVKSGTYRFEDKQTLAPGQYIFLLNGKRLFNFLISSEKWVDLQFSAKIEHGRATQITAKGDKENNAYIEFQRFIQEANRNPNTPLSEYDISQIDRYADSIAKRFPNTVLALIANFTSKPPHPKYMALHDPRVLNTSYLPLLMRNYFTNLVSDHSYSVIPQVDSILNRCTNPLVKEWCGEFLLNYFFSSNIMGMENVTVHIAKKYLDGELKASDNEMLAELWNYVAFNERCLLGMPAPELRLPDLSNQLKSLRDIRANYTILLFYDDDCPICREEIPKINEIYRQYRTKGVAVYAVYTQDRYNMWRNYTQNLNEWIHVWDPYFASGFHRLYNVTGTPKLYLLDRNKTIIGRGIDSEILQQLLTFYINKETVH